MKIPMSALLKAASVAITTAEKTARAAAPALGRAARSGSDALHTGLPKLNKAASTMLPDARAVAQFGRKLGKVAIRAGFDAWSASLHQHGSNPVGERRDAPASWPVPTRPPGFEDHPSSTAAWMQSTQTSSWPVPARPPGVDSNPWAIPARPTSAQVHGTQAPAATTVATQPTKASAAAFEFDVPTSVRQSATGGHGADTPSTAEATVANWRKQAASKTAP